MWIGQNDGRIYVLAGQQDWDRFGALLFMAEGVSANTKYEWVGTWKNPKV